MIVCVCNVIRETELEQVARMGAGTVAQAYRALGKQAKCGQCTCFARQIIDCARATDCQSQLQKVA
ncbi:(2Fe-2S)-binding protein [Sphingomonas sp. BGYR3]|uniref:(2Fe-2S)-binding protein n=1 Tax=Sphingomonas sp. BGYR3 TaxID=2975483 RepID=UPI0021A917D0|nr:(2Fe-2S)-binding protein [Sphingomonas sp. BGYR3]MDG5487608.1 (2Fe-2S)-binding protein [Sphingomonas sp. BGYR3]